jgi:uncharacterized protein with GYD domain
LQCGSSCGSQFNEEFIFFRNLPNGTIGEDDVVDDGEVFDDGALMVVAIKIFALGVVNDVVVDDVSAAAVDVSPFFEPTLMRV